MMRARRLVVAAVLASALLITLGMLARTELVAGDRVRAVIAARAAALGADVEVHSVAPHGLFSVELDRVSARIPRGEVALEVDVASVVITPTLRSLFGTPELASVDVRDGVIAVVPWRAPAPAAPRAAPTPKPKTAPAPKAKRPPTPIDVTLERVEVVASNAAYQTVPLQVRRAEFRWTRGTPIARLAAYGELPDGVPYSLTSPTTAGVYRLRPERPTNIQQWIDPASSGVRWPVSLQVRDIRLCPSCEDVVVLEEVELAVPAWREDVRVITPSAAVQRRGSEVSLTASEIAIVDPQADHFAARITESSFRYSVDSGHLAGSLKFAAEDGNTLRVAWTWDSEDFIVDFAADAFPLHDVWHLVPLGERAKPRRMDGELRVAWDMRHMTVRVMSDLHLTHLTLRVPFTRETIDLADARLRADVYLDARGRTLSVHDATLGLGEVTLDGSLQLVDANDGYSFAATLSVPQRPAATWLRTLPPQWTEVVDGATLQGSFGFDLNTAGHTAFPESLTLEAQPHGEVTVVQDGAADVRAFAGSGPPRAGQALPHWVSLRDVGEATWGVILAAEDAKFMQHDGFDWPGFRRAMIHNLEVGRPARGGSTITQQVAKNLFLDGERTFARKLQEAYLTWRLEQLLPKQRILELYLNIANWGANVRGIGAAAHHYFGVPPAQLDTLQAALLGAILPNPARFGGWIDRGQLAASRLEKVEHILSNLRFLKKITPAQYDALWRAAQRGEFGELRLTVCDDVAGHSAAPAC